MKNKKRFFNRNAANKRLFFRSSRKKKSKSIARERLQVLLVSDRIDCSPEMMEMIKNDIIRVISKYMEIDETETEIHIHQSASANKRGYSASICASVPVKSISHG